MKQFGPQAVVDLATKIITMVNLKCIFSYLGTYFHGSAEQVGIPIEIVPTVVGKIREVIEMVTQSKVRINLAGRTDRGVHARAQVANFFVDESVDQSSLFRTLNARLSPQITFHSLEKVDDDFHARFSAKARTYRYYIYNGENPHPFYSDFTWHIYNNLNFKNMVLAAKHFVGEHDFTTFCRTNTDVKHNIRKVVNAELSIVDKDLFSICDVSRKETRLICFEIKANAFCWQMVRSIMGTLVDVGRDKVNPDDIPAMIKAKDRSITKQLALPHGLTLFSIEY